MSGRFSHFINSGVYDVSNSQGQV